MASKKPNLLGAIASAKNRVHRREVAGIDKAPVDLEAIDFEISEAESKLRADTRLWARSWVSTVVRASEIRLAAHPGAQSDALQERLQVLSERLDALDDAELGLARARLRSGDYPSHELRQDIEALPGFERDAFIERLLTIHKVPKPEREREEDMVHYLGSPLGSILEICERVGPSDVFYDLGSGLGKVTLLVGLFSGARCKGVEFDPAYARVAADRARELQLDRVEIICDDARELEYADATHVYLFDPFRGAILSAVLEQLKSRARAHPLVVFARGASSEFLSAVPWLHREESTPTELVVFRSTF